MLISNPAASKQIYKLTYSFFTSFSATGTVATATAAIAAYANARANRS